MKRLVMATMICVVLSRTNRSIDAAGKGANVDTHRSLSRQPGDQNARPAGAGAQIS